MLDQIKGAISTALIAVYDQLKGAAANYSVQNHQVFGLYGADVAFLQNGSARLFEINLGPSLSTKNDVDSQIKSQMLEQMYQLIGLRRVGEGINSVSISSKIEQHLEKKYSSFIDEYYSQSMTIQEYKELLEIALYEEERERRGKWILLELYGSVSPGEYNGVLSLYKKYSQKVVSENKSEL